MRGAHFAVPSPCEGEDEGEGPNTALPRDSRFRSSHAFRARLKILSDVLSQRHHLRPASAIRPLKLRAAIASSLADSRRREPARSAPRDHHHRRPRRQLRPQLFPETFAHATLDPVAHDRDTDSARHRHAQPRALRLILKTPRIDHEMRSRKSHAVSLEAQKLGAPMQPVGRGEAQLRAHSAQPGCLAGIEIARRARPFARRRLRILRPPGVAIRARNPWVRLRRRLCGW